MLHKDIKRGDIQKYAWTYLIADQLKMYHRNTNLAQMHDLIRSIPRVYQEQLLGDSYSFSSSTVDILNEGYGAKTFDIEETINWLSTAFEKNYF